MKKFLNPNKSKFHYGIVIAIAVFLIFTVSLEGGIGKLLQPENSADFFAGLGIPFFMIYVVGFAEAVAPFLMFFRSIAGYAGLVSSINYAGILFVQVTALDGVSLLAAACFLLSVLVFWLMRPEFLRKKRVITKISI